jgi:hypothetical protein
MRFLALSPDPFPELASGFRKLPAGFGCGAREFGAQLRLGHSDVLPGQISPHFLNDIRVPRLFKICRDDGLGLGFGRFALRQTQPGGRHNPNNRLRRAVIRNASS